MTIPEQRAQHTRVPPRASRTVDHAAPPLPASPHFIGHAAGWHGEDQPYTTDPMEQQRWRPASLSREDEEVGEDEEDEFFFFPTRMPRSAIRYQMNTQHPPTRQVMAQTPRPVTVYHTRGRTQTAEDQPSTAHPPLRHPRVHWLVYLGLSLLIADRVGEPLVVLPVVAG